MKEATGELNMTVITVVAIAAVGAFFTAFIWPGIRANINASTYCAGSYNCNDDYTSCSYTDKDGKEATGLNCKAYFDKQNNGSVDLGGNGGSTGGSNS